MAKVISLNKKIDRLNQYSILEAGRPAEDGVRAHTIPISVKWEDGEVSNAYLKCYGNSLPTGLVNEVTGFIIGKACGLPLPRKMGLIELPEDFCNQHSFLRWGVVVSEVPGSSMKSIWKVHGSSKAALNALLERLFQWSSVENMLAFDDWVANSDRNIGNVIFYAPGKYGLIDHSDMPVKPNWSPDDLDPDVQVTSVLAKEYGYPEVAEEDKKNKLKQFAAQHFEVYNNVKDDLYHWWKEALVLAGGHEFAAERLESLRVFIEARAERSIPRIESNSTLLKAS